MTVVHRFSSGSHSGVDTGGGALGKKPTPLSSPVTTSPALQLLEAQWCYQATAMLGCCLQFCEGRTLFPLTACTTGDAVHRCPQCWSLTVDALVDIAQSDTSPDPATNSRLRSLFGRPVGARECPSCIPLSLPHTITMLLNHLASSVPDYRSRGPTGLVGPVASDTLQRVKVQTALSCPSCRLWCGCCIAVAAA
jgi:hypothetical protein